MTLEKEPVVFVGEAPQKLRCALRPSSRITVTGPEGMICEEGSDYTVDPSAGTLRRMPGGRIPDWLNHPLYGLDGFDHREVADYSNAPYTCTVAYEREGEAAGAAAARHGYGRLPALRRKLERGERVLYVACGDSISAGYEASCRETAYVERLAAAIRERYPRAEIVVRNQARGGESAPGGAARFAEDVLRLRPDLVTIAYGMNDQNRQSDGGNATPLPEFERLLMEMASRALRETSAEVALVTPCLPNPRWMFASGNVGEYASAVRRVGERLGIAVADVQSAWREALEAGMTHESLLLNNLNHPNDYGHALYAGVLAELLLWLPRRDGKVRKIRQESQECPVSKTIKRFL